MVISKMETVGCRSTLNRQKVGEVTYKESYLNCKTFEEMEEMVKKDVATAAMWLDPDRISVIEKVMNEVCNEKGWNKND